MKVKDLVSVIDFDMVKWLNVGYFDENNTFVNIMEYCDNAIIFENNDTKENIIMDSVIDKIWSVSFGKDMDELFVTTKEDKEKE